MLRLLIVSFSLFIGSQTLAADCGIFRIVKNDVTFMKNTKKKFRKARVNRKVCAGDRVKTGKNGRAKIVMADKNEINLSPNSEFLIEKYEGKSPENKKVLLNVIYGKIRSNVKQKYKGDQSSFYRVKTKSAVAGVRGTEFMTSFDPATNQSKVVTFKGAVSVGKFENGSIKFSVTVKPGQFTSSSPSSAPHSPKTVPPKEFAQLDKDSSVGPSTSRRGVSNEPTQSKKDQKKNKESQNDKKNPGDPSKDNQPGDKNEKKGPNAKNNGGGSAKSPSNSPKSPNAPGPRSPASTPLGDDFDAQLDEVVDGIDQGPEGGPGLDIGGNLPPPPPSFIDPGQIVTPIDRPNQAINDTIQNKRVNLRIIPCIEGSTCN